MLVFSGLARRRKKGTWTVEKAVERSGYRIQLGRQEKGSGVELHCMAEMEVGGGHDARRGPDTADIKTPVVGWGWFDVSFKQEKSSRCCVESRAVGRDIINSWLPSRRRKKIKWVLTRGAPAPAVHAACTIGPCAVLPAGPAKSHLHVTTIWRCI